jgi:hypothetical protein
MRYEEMSDRPERRPAGYCLARSNNGTVSAFLSARARYRSGCRTIRWKLRMEMGIITCQ